MPPPKPKSDNKKQADRPTTKRRPYNSPLRRQQSAQTRERIIAAGSELVHGLPTWDWKNLTARAVGERAGVSERTVHRYFSTERKLRDAVIQRLVEESGVALDDLELGDFASATAQLFSYLASFAVKPETVTDPSLATVDEQRRHALQQAVVRATPAWSDRDQQAAAAVLDILWQPPLYDRLTMIWGFDADRAVGVITWLIGLIEEAIRHNRLPEAAP